MGIGFKGLMDMMLSGQRGFWAWALLMVEKEIEEDDKNTYMK